jgi:hypothetical protein
LLNFLASARAALRITDWRQTDRKMTGDKSRLLKIGDRVCWGATTTDLGTIAGTAWSGLTIDWDNGHSSSVQHNDMSLVTVVPSKI